MECAVQFSGLAFGFRVEGDDMGILSSQSRRADYETRLLPRDCTTLPGCKLGPSLLRASQEQVEI